MDQRCKLIETLLLGQNLSINESSCEMIFSLEKPLPRTQHGKNVAIPSVCHLNSFLSFEAGKLIFCIKTPQIDAKKVTIVSGG